MSRPRHSKFVREVKVYAESCGFEGITIGYRGKHPALHGRIYGKSVSVTIPGSPGDQRSRDNAFAYLRRVAREARP
jgi:hypothetical protein